MEMEYEYSMFKKRNFSRVANDYMCEVNPPNGVKLAPDLVVVNTIFSGIVP